MSTEALSAAREDGVDPRIWKVAAVVSLGPFMSVLDSTVVNVSLATIRDDFHSTLASAQWIISGYLLALALVLPLNGWLVDRIGAKRLYLGCFSAFTLASLLCGISKTMDGLIYARIVQGIAGGLLAPMTQLMMARIAGKQLARMMGYVGIPILIAPILGPVVAGAVLKYASWPWLFFLNLPIGVLAVALAYFLIPHDEASIKRRPFDFPGFFLLSPALAGILYGLERAAHGGSYLIFIVGIIFLGLFIAHARRKKSHALVDLSLFSRPIFSRAAITQFLANGQAYAGQFLIPIYLITGCGFSASRTGWILAPSGIGMICTFPLMGFFTDRFGCRAVSRTGALVALLGTLPFLWMMSHEFLPAVAMVSLWIRGAGQGAISIPSVSAAYSSVPKERLAVATTAINIVQRLGGPLATTLMAIVISLSSFHIAFFMLAAIHLLGLWAANRLPISVHAAE